MNKPTMQIALCFAAVFIATQLFAFRADEPVSGSAKTATAAALKAAPKKMPTAEQKAAADILDGAKVEWDAKTGAPASIRGKDLSAKNLGGKGLSLSPNNDFAVDAIAVMDRMAKAYQLRDASTEFKTLKTDADEIGFHHVRLNQMNQGLRVVGAQLIVHFDKSGNAYQVNGRYIPGIAVETKAFIDEESAIESVQRDLVQMGKPAEHLKGTIELVIYARDVLPVLAHEFVFGYDDKEMGPGCWRYWINARDGSVINRYNDIRKSDAAISGNLNSGEGDTSVGVTGDYNGSDYYLRYTTRHWEIYDYPNSRTARNSTASWPTNTSGRSEISAAYNFDLIQTYYYDVHNRNSYDNSGTLALVNVHATGDTDNAGWDSNEQAFFFYPGSVLAELTVLDVCAHEFTHAVTEHSSDLVYQNEPGALNESFSDVLGTAIEFANQPDGRSSYPDRTAGYADWLLGEDCTYPTGDDALRDMRDPQRYDSPSKYHGTHWYSGSSDYGGVHYNSGVQNHFFYLLSEGGRGDNDGISYNITGITIENAHLIAYRALTVYCTPNTDYAAAPTAWISAANDLNTSWASAVQAAWAAVGVIPTTPADVVASQGVYCQKVRVTWSEVSGADYYEVWRKNSGAGNRVASDAAEDSGGAKNAGDETKIADVTAANYDDSSATDVTQDYTYRIKAVNSTGTSDFSSESTGYVKTGPDLKVNDSDGPVSLPYGSRVIITAHMNPESSEIGAMRDWWVVKYAPDGWYYRWGTGFWDYIPDLTYIEPTVQAGLGFIPSYTLIDSTNLSRGTYTYYFGVDACDGYLTDYYLEYDSVTITIY